MAMQHIGETLIFSLSTKRFLFDFRSKHVSDPYSWGLFGGEHRGVGTIIQTVINEVLQKTNHSLSPENIHFLHKQICLDGKEQVETFISFVDHEFIPELTEESASYKWCTLVDRPEMLQCNLDVVLSDPHCKKYLNSL